LLAVEPVFLTWAKTVEIEFKPKMTAKKRTKNFLFIKNLIVIFRANGSVYKDVQKRVKVDKRKVKK
jgi:hypothetical protein